MKEEHNKLACLGLLKNHVLMMFLEIITGDWIILKWLFQIFYSIWKIYILISTCIYENLLTHMLSRKLRNNTVYVNVMSADLGFDYYSSLSNIAQAWVIITQAWVKYSNWCHMYSKRIIYIRIRRIFFFCRIASCWRNIDDVSTEYISISHRAERNILKLKIIINELTHEDTNNCMRIM